MVKKMSKSILNLMLENSYKTMYVSLESLKLLQDLTIEVKSKKVLILLEKQLDFHWDLDVFKFKSISKICEFCKLKNTCQQNFDFECQEISNFLF